MGLKVLSSSSWGKRERSRGVEVGGPCFTDQDRKPWSQLGERTAVRSRNGMGIN